MTRDELIDDSSQEFATQAFKREMGYLPLRDGFVAGINSQLNKDLTELAVIEALIKETNRYGTSVDRLIQLETQRTELLNRLNITENKSSYVAEVKEKSFMCEDSEHKMKCVTQCDKCKLKEAFE